MFENEIQEALDTFDDLTQSELISPEELLEDAKDKNSSLYKDLKELYDLFEYHNQQNEIFAGSEYISSIKSSAITLFKKYKMYTPIINSFMGFLCFHDEDYGNAQTYFLKDDNYLDAFLVCLKQLETNNDSKLQNTAFNLAIKELEIECTDKSVLFINFGIFKFIIEYCNQINDFSTIVNFIDIMYSTPFKKNQKFEDFYYSLIKLSFMNNLNLRFLQNKDFFSKENFQTVCVQIKEALSTDDKIQQDIVLSFDDLLAKGDILKNQKDFVGAESIFREAIEVASSSKQKQKAFKELSNLYRYTDYVKMLSIINEFFDIDVFETDYDKYYTKSQMLIFTNADYIDIYDNLNFLIQSIPNLDRKPWRWNEPITQCMDLIKTYVQNLLQVQSFDNAHAMCKLGLSLSSQIKKSDITTDGYLKFFSNTQTKCGKVKKDLAKKGTAKIIESTVQIENTKSNKEVISQDPDNMPIFKFNPSGLLQYIEISSLEDYEQYLSDYNSTTKKLNQDGISKKILKLITNTKISDYIKSLYILDDNFIGTPKQARKDMDFYLNSKIRKAFDKKRDEYLSLAKIVSNVIERYGENEEFNITIKSQKEYIMYAMLYHSKCVSSEESKRYYLNIAKLIYAELYNSFSFDEKSLASYESE